MIGYLSSARIMEDNTVTTHSHSEAIGGRNNKLGKIFSSFLNSIKGFSDPSLLALIKQIASSSPSATDVEVAWLLLGNSTGTGFTLPMKIPPAPALSFPDDHGLHWDMSIEWYFFTLSLNLDQGGRISVIVSFLLKAIGAPTSKPKGTSHLDQQIFSRSLGITIEMPGKPSTHYSYPVTTFTPVEGDVKYNANPFRLSLGKDSIKGCVDVFPLDLHLDGLGDHRLGRPAIEVDVHCAAENPPFLQFGAGYVPPVSGTPYYYYSWPNQPTAGTVTIDGEPLAAEGITWSDHQWGSAVVPSGPEPLSWDGWCWFEFQFDGNRALTGGCETKGPVDGKSPRLLFGMGTYVEGKSSTQVEITLELTEYAKSPDTDAIYPRAWKCGIVSSDPNVEILLDVIPTTVCDQQALWEGGLIEYAEAAVTVTATGLIEGKLVTMEGVGYCESIGVEDPAEVVTRAKTWLHSSLQKHGTCHPQ
jgi:predicted secreted hydrolase